MASRSAWASRGSSGSRFRPALRGTAASSSTFRPPAAGNSGWHHLLDLDLRLSANDATNDTFKPAHRPFQHSHGPRRSGGGATTDDDAPRCPASPALGRRGIEMVSKSRNACWRHGATDATSPRTSDPAQVRDSYQLGGGCPRSTAGGRANFTGAAEGLRSRHGIQRASASAAARHHGSGSDAPAIRRTRRARRSPES